MIHSLGHLLLHMGPGVGMLVIIVWAMWRTGQLANSSRAAELPLEIPGSVETPVRARRLPLDAIAMAILLGIGIGIPIAAVVISSHIQTTDTLHKGTEAGH